MGGNVAGNPMAKPFNVSGAGGAFSADGKPGAPAAKVFGGKSYFRNKPAAGQAAGNKSFGEESYFRKQPLNQRVFGGGATSRFACGMYGFLLTALIVLAIFGWYQWKEYTRRRHYRLLGSFRDSRYPTYELDPDCDDCDYKQALPQQLDQRQPQKEVPS